MSTLLTSFAVAQVAIPAHSAVYNGFSRGYTFTANVPFLINQLELPLDAFQAGDTAGFLVRINGTTTLRSVGNVGALLNTGGIPVNIGDVVDIIGNWSPAVPGNFTAHNSYTPAVAPFATTIEGVAHTLNRSGWQWDISDPNWTSGAYLAPVAGQMGRVLMYTSAIAGTVATNTTTGAGCVRKTDSFYQLFANATTASSALSGNSLLLVPTGSGYQGSWLPGTASTFFVAPVTPTTLITNDDGTATYGIVSGSLPTPNGPQTNLVVSGNGIVAWGTGAMDYPGTNAYTPTAAGFLNSTLGGVYAWHDFNSTEVGSGPIVAEEIGSTLYVTYNGVENYANPEVLNPSTVQFQFDLNSGVITVVFPSIDSNSTSTFGSGFLVGVTGPGASQDTGTIVLATATPSQLLTEPELLPLALAANSRPITGTNWNFTTSNVPATGVAGIDIGGVSDPSVNDLAVIGMPGCGLRANLDALVPWTVTGPTHSFSLPVPANPALVGLHIYLTSAVLQVPPVNAFGLITANGIDGTIGDV